MLVRFVGGDTSDDIWLPISDTRRVRPPQVPVGNAHGQVGNHAKVMFLEDKGKGYKEPVWYQGEITTFSMRSPGEGKPEEWMFTLKFDDEEEHHVKLPDSEVRIFRPLSDLLNALTDIRDHARDALENYANQRELQRAVIASIHGVVKNVFTEIEGRVKTRSKEVKAADVPLRPNPKPDLEFYTPNLELNSKNLCPKPRNLKP